MSIVIGNKKIEIPGLKTVSFLDGVPSVKEINHSSARHESIHMIVAHTHKGIHGQLLTGMGPNSTVDDALIHYQVTTDRAVSWDYTVDKNGDVTAQSDPLRVFSWQATVVNPRSLGFEMIQNENGDTYEGEVAQAVLLIDALTALLGIQRQICWDSSHGTPKQGVVKRLQDGGQDVVGIVGHRNISTDRGPGDPGDYIFAALKAAGYEFFDLDKAEDTKIWKARQQALGIPVASCDGIPMKGTVAALKAAGHKNGLWVKRPIDDLLIVP